MEWGTLKVLRDRNTGLYLGGVLVSQFGTSAMSLVAGVWVKSLTGSSSLAALTTFCVWVPTLVGPVIGTVADRVRRRPLLIGTNLVMAALMLVLLTVQSAQHSWILFAVLVVYGTSTVLLDAVEAAVVTVAVPQDLCGDFNGLRMTVNESMKLIAPLAGAGLFVQFGGTSVVLLDAATFVLAAGAFALMRVREPAPATDKRGWWAQTVEGIHYLWQHPVLRRLVLVGSATMMVAALNGAVTYAVVDAGLHRAPAFAGVLYAVQGAGSVISGLVAGPLLRRMSERAFAAAGVVLFAIGVALRATPWVEAALGASLLIGLGLPCALIVAMTAVQRETPGALVGRVAATASTLLFAPHTVALLASAGLVALVDHRILVLAAGAVALAIGWWCRRPVPAVTTAVPG